MKKPAASISRFRVSNLLPPSKLEIVLFLLVLGMAIFLRFYQIEKLHFFTYDQARDNLIAARIIKDRRLTLLGPQSSIGGVYSPPWYYYTITLPLWLFRLNPVGVDIYTALIGVLTVALVYLAANLFFGQPAGLFASALYAVSPVVVELSRRAWNPNTLPFFSLLTLVLAYLFWQTKKPGVLFALSFVFGYTLSLHYSVFCLLPAIIFLWFDYFKKERKVKPVLISVVVIGFFFLPLALFELRHDFILTAALKDYFLQKGAYYLGQDRPSFIEASLASIYEVIVVPLAGYFVKGASGTSAPYQFAGRIKDVLFQFSAVSIIAHKPLVIRYYQWGISLFLALVVFSLWQIFWRRSRNKKLIFLWGWLLPAILVSRLYRGTIYFFYYLFLYPLPFLLLAAFLKWFFEMGKTTRILGGLLLLLIVGVNWQQSMIYETTGRTLEDIEAVAGIISQDVDKSVFNVATAYKDPDRWDHHGLDYRYFIEAYFEKKPLDWYPESYAQAEILYLVSENEMENPLSSNIMEVAKFGPQKVLRTWSYQDEIFIYKLGKN